MIQGIKKAPSWLDNLIGCISYASHNGEYRRGQAWLGKRLGKCQQAISYELKIAAALGIIEITQSYHKNVSNIIRIIGWVKGANKIRQSLPKAIVYSNSILERPKELESLTIDSYFMSRLRLIKPRINVNLIFDTMCLFILSSYKAISRLTSRPKSVRHPQDYVSWGEWQYLHDNENEENTDDDTESNTGLAEEESDRDPDRDSDGERGLQ